MSDGINCTNRIVVTDDDPLLRELLSLVLEGRGYELLMAENGREVQTLVAEHDVGLILLDLMMPVMDGIQFLRWLRKEKESSIPVLVLSAMIKPGLEHELYALGATAVMAKPISMEHLVAEVERLLGGNGCSARSSPLRSFPRAV